MKVRVNRDIAARLGIHYQKYAGRLATVVGNETEEHGEKAYGLQFGPSEFATLPQSECITPGQAAVRGIIESRRPLIEA